MDTLVLQLKPMYYLLSIVILLSCSSKKESNNILQSPVKIEASERAMHSVVKEYFFSSKQIKDQFRIELTGRDTLNGKVKFQILTQAGDSIYSTEFESSALIDHALPPNSTDTDKGKYIIKRMNEFFNEDNFVKPAIGSKEVYDKDYYGVVDEATWKELRRGEVVGFYYLLWEGDQVWIAFFNRDKKVIKYKTCC